MDVSTLTVALGYTKKQIEEVKREGFRVQVEQDRSILETTGEEKVFYFLPKNPQKTKDGYDEFIYTNNDWEQVGVTDIDLSAYALKSEIPTKVSQLQNDSGYLTQHQDISGKADKATTLAGYGITDGQQKIDSNNKLLSDLVDDSNQTNKFVTDNEKNSWNTKYDKPVNGIPKTDLDSSVQTSLGKADTALQSYTEQYTGTVTGITMNGNSLIPTNGIINLGTVITTHQDISGKENINNKVTSWQNIPDNDHYPSELLVKDGFNYIASHFVKNPVLLYDKTNKMYVTGTINPNTDSANGLINQAQGEGTSYDISSWNIEGMDLSEFQYIRVVFRRNNASYACTGEFNIPLDCDPVSTRNLYVSGYTTSVYGDRNRLLCINCAIDSNKSKFCITQTISLYETIVTVVDDLFVEKIYGCY